RYKREFDEVGLLSSGSFGQVFRATNKMDGFNYAVKRVPFNATGFSSDSVQQVVREVHCLAVCDHPNVVRYYTSWLEPRKKAAGPSYQYQICLYIQMQLCHPATLADWIRERNRKLHDEHAGNRLVFAADIFSQLCDGLAHVHSKGIVHRDLKPANVFASQDEKVQFKIGDFGLSKMIESTCGNDTWRDPLTAGVGTASYAAPEQVSSGSYGKEADIFSLGLI
ncbi:predicted protein, partial [Phaeodactylum tricornutum CCAP 1055/1]